MYTTSTTVQMGNNPDVSLLSVPKISLRSGIVGREIPALGLGTAADPPVDFDTIRLAVVQAIEIGYRHFDTAALYNSEQPLGEAITEAIQRGLIKSREELFITSKLWCSDAHPQHVLPAIQKTLGNLNLEYLDLYLVHWPVSSRPGIYEYPIKKEDFSAMDFKGVWASMEECQRRGLTKSIGVSNFSSKKLANVLATAKIPPAVNQVEVNPCWQQKKLREYCKSNGILVVAYAALGAVGTFYGTNRVMECHVLKKIAEERAKTVPQVCLRWAYEQGIGIEGGYDNHLLLYAWNDRLRVAKKVKGSSTFREVPVVIMSSERIDRCLEEGAEDFIVKLADVKRLKDYVFGEDKLVSENRGMNKKVAKCVRLFLRFNARRSLDDTWDQRMS